MGLTAKPTRLRNVFDKFERLKHRRVPHRHYEPRKIAGFHIKNQTKFSRMRKQLAETGIQDFWVKASKLKIKLLVRYVGSQDNLEKFEIMNNELIALYVALLFFILLAFISFLVEKKMALLVQLRVRSTIYYKKLKSMGQDFFSLKMEVFISLLKI